jgi:hypothetical protein
MQIKNFINTTVVLTAVVFFAVNIIVVSCCKKKVAPITTKTCGTNQVLKNDSCVCDNNSVWNGTECKYALPNIGSGFIGFTKLNASISSECGDWRDSLVIPFIPSEFTAISNDFSIGIRTSDNKYPSDAAEISYYNSGPFYDSVVSQIITINMYPGLRRFDMYMRMTKSRDTMWATVCNVSIIPVYKRLDTCKVILTKIL